MKLTFRQGIARYQTDVYATPTFLKKSSLSGEFIDLIVSPDPTIIIFAHRNATYVVEESRTVERAWGPFTAGQTATRYLYWDINLLDGALTRGYTLYPQIVAGVAPSSPTIDQHWFDTAEKQMKVWNGHKWLEKVRLFAATYSSQAIIQPMPLGSQAGQVGSFEAGNLILDSFNKPVRSSDGTFLTTVTELSIINAGTRQFKFEGEVVSAMADEFIPAFSFVQTLPNRKLRLARSSDWQSRVVGIVTEDLYKSEVGIVTTDGLIRNEQWNFPSNMVGRPVFCGSTGEVTLVPPAQGVSQICGYVQDADSMHLNIKGVTILDDFMLPTPAPKPRAPVAQFYASPTTGTLPLTVHFTSTSLYEPTSFAWDIGNNGSLESTASAFSYTFASPGKYTVALKVQNDQGTDTVVQTDLISVAEPVVVPAPINPTPSPTGTTENNSPTAKTNLSIQLGATLQVTSGQAFNVAVIVSNDGRRTATNVTRSIVIEDMGQYPITITGAPTNTTTKVVGKTLVVSLPVLPTLNGGQNTVSNFTVNTPAAKGTIALRATVMSPETDAETGDNVTALFIKVK